MASNRFSVLQVSDLHIDPGLPTDWSVLDRVRQYIEQLKPDLIAVTGDVSQQGVKHPEVFATIRDALQQWPAPVRVIPGNHDIGDRFEKIHPKINHLEKWISVFGIDRFSVESHGWRVLGLDSEIMGVGLPEEEEQHRWLIQQMDGAEAEHQCVAVFMHGPPYLLREDEQFHDHSSYWAVKRPSRRRLLEQLERPHVRLLANGHMHWYHQRRHAQVPWYWAPSAKAVVDDAKFPDGGEVVGIMHYELGDGAVQARLLPFDVPPMTYYFGRPKIVAPGRKDPIELAHAVVPLHDTLSSNGSLKPEVLKKLQTAADQVRITVLAGDLEQARRVLGSAPVTLRHAGDLPRVLDTLGRHRVIAIGHSGVDDPLLQQAAIAVSIGGGCPATLKTQVPDVLAALDLLANPRKLEAALRN